MPRPAWFSRPSRPLYLLLAVALTVLALWGFWPRAQQVEAARVTRGPLMASFTEEGRTRLRDRYEVSAPLDGVVERIELEPGDPVKAGMPVAVIRPANATLFDPASRSEAESRWHVAGDELDAAVATALAAEASRDRQHAALRRAESLSAQQLIAADQRDEIRAQAVAAESNVRSAQARAQAARVRRDSARAVLDLQGAASRGEANRLSLSSPIHGRVIRRLVESEGVVRAGQALLEVGDPSDLEVIVEALTADSVRVGPGTRVRLLRWGGDAPLRGRVQTIEPGGFTKVSALGVEEQRVLVVIALDGPRDKRSAIGDGFRVEAEFLVWEAGNVLTVPVAALFRDGREWAVYAIDDGRARMRRVEIGHFGENAAEVRAGLREGAHVILYPGDRLRDGARVEYRTP